MYGQAPKLRESRDMARKRRWFERGAAAFRHAFPKALTFLGGNPPPHYACPECAEPDKSGLELRVRLLPKSALTRGELTAEHVPPNSFGGRRLVLTCKACNDFAGHQLDAHARKHENPGDALVGAARKSSHVAVTMDEHTVAASLKVKDRMLDLTIPPLKTNANDPRVLEEFWGVPRLSTGESREITIAFSGDSHSPRRARVSWLRHGYLALFAILGYRYIFHPALNIVRKQIKEPDGNHIPLFLAMLPERRPWTERRVVFIRQPEWHCCWAVQFGHYMVFLPTAGDVCFYPRFAAKALAGSGQSDFSGDAFEWPAEPLFCLDAEGSAVQPTQPTARS